MIFLREHLMGKRHFRVGDIHVANTDSGAWVMIFLVGVRPTRIRGNDFLGVPCQWFKVDCRFVAVKLAVCVSRRIPTGIIYIHTFIYIYNIHMHICRQFAH